MTMTGPSGVIPTLSIPLPNWSENDPDHLPTMLARARAADRAGVDRLAVSDHVVYGEHLDAYGNPRLGGSAGGRQPTGPDGDWLEPLVVLTTVAAQTTRVRLHTAILLAALRRPAVLAKTAASIDVVSGGRLELGVGVGWQREEYDAAGLRFEDRGALLDQTLEVCRALWTERVASYTGPGLAFDRIHCMPKPTQDGGVPVWVSGTANRRVLERIVAYGDGWIPWGDDQRDVVSSVAHVHRALRDAGRALDGFEVTGYLPRVKGADGGADLAATMAQVPPMVAAGITDFRCNIAIPADEDAATAVLTEWVDAFRGAVGR